MTGHSAAHGAASAELTPSFPLTAPLLFPCLAELMPAL